MYAYIAGPLYNESDRWFDEIIDQHVQDAGIPTFLPHRDAGIMTSINDRERIFRDDLSHLEKATLIVANLNGVATDVGTAWEIGYAYARGKFIIGVHTDQRVHVRHAEVNLMVLQSLNIFVTDIQKLPEAIEKYLLQATQNKG